MARIVNVFTAVACGAVCCSLMAPAARVAAQNQALNETDQRPVERLKTLNSMVGEWNGVGQVKRGSRAGAWTEKAVCEWSFEKERSAIIFRSEGGQQFTELKLSWDSTAQTLVLNQKLGDLQRTYTGIMPERWPDRVELISTTDDSGVTYRCTIQQLSDIRSTLLFEKQTSPNGSFRRIAGIGYTRAGEQLAQAGGNQRKCIVTGGLGTIPVSYKGKTYYVCCQGCVQAFNDAPDEIVADYLASLKEQ